MRTFKSRCSAWPELVNIWKPLIDAIGPVLGEDPERPWGETGLRAPRELRGYLQSAFVTAQGPVRIAPSAHHQAVGADAVEPAGTPAAWRPRAPRWRKA
jgi:hypothetical protein